MKRNETQRKYVDGLRSSRTGGAWRAHVKEWISAHAHKTPVLVAFASLLILSNSVIYLTAFEAHVVNVTATIERPPTMCNALSIGYWKNHDGCSGGEGESDWTSEIRVITTEFKGIFYDITGAEICEALWIPNCPSGNNILSKRCKATAMALGDELNLVSGHLDIDALIAGADDGSAAFDHLGLTYNSTVRDALTKVEDIIGNLNSTKSQLTDAAYVAERIYSFYEDENPNAPQCVTDPKEPKQCSVETTYTRESGFGGDTSDEDEEGDNDNSDSNGNGNSGGGEHDGSRGAGGHRENGSSESTNGEGERAAISTDETATSTEEVLGGEEQNGMGGENNGEAAGQNATSSESTETTATSSEEQVSP